MKAGREPLPADLFSWSTHHFGLAQAVELGRALDRWSATRMFLGSEGREFTYTADLSPPVAEAVDRVFQRLIAERPRDP